ncbi:Crp/Fnr family transcriptional regulator [Raoultella sp. WB_B2P2-3]|uniref:Crp/Fnr family transcriptional regulator n=1 Tax=Raoultella scottii TaxID=3040937 RepID=A0ABU8Z217_9ENTR|nr:MULTISPECIES: Crp/Fnr family transcriptional regulator [Enterobacteriaceae]MVT05978.1 cyclic nucleotide-binding domain-containing protein [Raoultella sp. 10-1]PAC07488.1 cAMP-binding protein [Enterobacter sp. 10-1]
MVKILAVAQESHEWNLQQDEIQAILLTSSWFRALPDYLSGQMLSRASFYQYENGEVIHYRGDESQALYAVITGSVKVSSVSADGKECIFRYLSPGNWFGEIGMIDKSVRTHDARALGKTILLTLKPRDVESLLQHYPILHHFLALLLCKVVRNAFTMLHDSALLSVSARLAKRLVSLSEGYGEWHEKGVLINLYLTQDDLATIINTTRQTINKRLVAWEKLGWIEAKYGKILIVNMSALRQLYIDEDE